MNNNIDKPTVFDVPIEYREIIEEDAKKKSERVISNSTFEHAVLLTYYLIENTKEKLMIFTSFSDLIYKDARIKKAIERAIKREVKIKILLEKKGSSKDKLFFSNASVKCKILKKGSKLRNYFLISDNLGFRIEEKHGPYHGKEPYLIKSMISFNSPEACDPLHKIFNSAFNPKAKS